MTNGYIATRKKGDIRSVWNILSCNWSTATIVNNILLIKCCCKFLCTCKKYMILQTRGSSFTFATIRTSCALDSPWTSTGGMFPQEELRWRWQRYNTDYSTKYQYYNAENWKKNRKTHVNKIAKTQKTQLIPNNWGWDGEGLSMVSILLFHVCSHFVNVVQPFQHLELNAFDYEFALLNIIVGSLGP